MCKMWFSMLCTCCACSRPYAIPGWHQCVKWVHLITGGAQHSDGHWRNCAHKRKCGRLLEEVSREPEDNRGSFRDPFLEEIPPINVIQDVRHHRLQRPVQQSCSRTDCQVLIFLLVDHEYFSNIFNYNRQTNTSIGITHFEKHLILSVLVVMRAMNCVLI